MPILGANSSGGSRPSAPTIGAASDGGTGTTVSVAFTPSSYIGKGTITYTATSSPGSLTGTASSSPITVSGLTTGTAYTFTVQGTTNYGVTSAVSSASNSVAPVMPTAFDSIATFVGDGSASTCTFTSIPQTYKSLQIRITARMAADYGNSQAIDYWFNANAGGGALYAFHRVTSNTSTLTADQQVGRASSNPIPNVIYAGATSNPYVGCAIVDILDYSSSSKTKTLRYVSGLEADGTLTGSLSMGSGLRNNTAAITRIDLQNTAGVEFAAGTVISLYGVN